MIRWKIRGDEVVQDETDNLDKVRKRDTKWDEVILNEEGWDDMEQN